MSRRGALIVLEGLDRSGKSTQCERLVANLQKEGRMVKHMRFPNRATSIGQSINSYLQGQTEADDHVIHLLFSANRWEAAGQMREDIENGITLVVDRYSYSGAVYSAAKHVRGLGLEWAWSMEVGLPEPDLLLFLDVSPDVQAQRGGFGEERYEESDMQRSVREMFDLLLTAVDRKHVELLERDGGREDSRYFRLDGARSIEDLGPLITSLARLVLGSPWLEKPLESLEKMQFD